MKIVTKVVEVTVGTNWYDPNTENKPLQIEGSPLTRDVKWRMRANYDDRLIVSMPPFNTPNPTHHSFQGKVDVVEYSVEPGQTVDHCTFRFKIGPFQ